MMSQETEVETGVDLSGQQEEEIFGVDETLVTEEVPELDDNEGESADEDQDGQPNEEQEPSQDDKATSGEDSYKELQRSFSHKTDELKDTRSELDALKGVAGRFGGIEKMAQLLDYVSSNGKIQEVIQSQISGQSGRGDDLGLDEMSPEGKKAVALVKKIVQADSGRMINQALSNFQKGSLDPFLATYQEEKLESLFDKLDSEFGDSWDKHYPTMKKLAEEWNPNVKANPSWKHMRKLYMDALDEDGGLDDFHEQRLLKKIQQKQQKSTGKPRSAGGSKMAQGDTKAPVKNIFDAAGKVEAKRRRR
jgi:hypothetical protein